MDFDQTPYLLILGGTFDPPHQGHLSCLDYTLKFFPRGRGLVVPAFTPPRRDGETKVCQLGFEERFYLCQQIFQQMPEHGRVEVLDVEKYLPSPSYTSQTLQRLREKFAPSPLLFIMGEDQLANFPTWRHATEVLQLTDLFVFKRHVETNQNATLRNTLRQALADLRLEQGISSGTEVQRVPIKKFDSVVWLANRSVSLASSEKIRHSLQNGLQVASDWIPQPILQTINNKGYYKKTMLEGSRKP